MIVFLQFIPRYFPLSNKLYLIAILLLIPTPMNAQTCSNYWRNSFWKKINLMYETFYQTHFQILPPWVWNQITHVPLAKLLWLQTAVIIRFVFLVSKFLLILWHYSTMCYWNVLWKGYKNVHTLSTRDLPEWIWSAAMSAMSNNCWKIRSDNWVGSKKCCRLQR